MSEPEDTGTPDVFSRCSACARLVPHSAEGGGAHGDPNLICLDDEMCAAFDRWVSL